MLGKLVPVLVGSPKRGADTLLWLAGTDRALPGGYYFLRTEFGALPWSGRLKISQSRSWPRPPSPMHPAPMPPSGNEI